MTHMTLKERYEMKQELLVEAFDKQALQKLASIIQQLSKVDFGGLSSFENLRGKINKAATRALKKRDEKSDQLIKKIVETIDVLKDFFGNLDEYVSAIAGTIPKDSVDLNNAKLIELIKNPEKIADNTKTFQAHNVPGVEKLSHILQKRSFLKMIQTGLKTKSGRDILKVGAAAKEVANLTLTQLKAISESVKQAYTSEQPQQKQQAPNQDQKNQAIASPEDSKTKVHDAKKSLESKVFNTFGAKNSGDLLSKLGLSKIDILEYDKLMSAIAKSLS